MIKEESLKEQKNDVMDNGFEEDPHAPSPRPSSREAIMEELGQVMYRMEKYGHIDYEDLQKALEGFEKVLEGLRGRRIQDPGVKRHNQEMESTDDD
jgi:hypothetical protein